MKTYSRKRRSQISPIRIFTDDETDHVPEMKKCHTPPPIVRTPPPLGTAASIDDGLLARSPARSDASSSMKSRESALERRVSLLLRSDSPTGFPGSVPSRSITPQPMLESSPRALPAPPEEPEYEDLVVDHAPKTQHRRLSSFAPTTFFSPKKSKEQLKSPPSKPKAKKLTKRMSTATQLNLMAKASPQSPQRCSPVPSSKSNTSIRNSIDAGLKVLTRAKSTLVRKTSPLIQSISRKNKEKKRCLESRENFTEQIVQVRPSTALNDFANSPTSTFFDSPRDGDCAWAPSARTMVPSRPFTSHTLPAPASEQRVASPTFSEKLDPLGQNPVDLDTDFEDLASRGPTRLRLTPSIRVNGSRRLSVTDADKPGPLDHVRRRSTDSTTSDPASSVGSLPLEHGLRRTTTRIHRSTLELSSSSDLHSSVSLRRPKSAGKLLSMKRSHDDVFVDPPPRSPSIAASTTGTDTGRGVLREVDPNKKQSYEDIGSVKVAKALRMSVSPKVKEVFNRIPRRRRSSHKFMPLNETRVSRSSSKASRVLGHQFSSKEPLRPLTSSETAVSDVREESMSDDELAL